MSGKIEIRVARGGEPTDEEMAALAVVLPLVFRPAAVAAPTGGAMPAESEWALRGRMNALEWQPLEQRWPGEPLGRSWRRVITT